MLFNDSIERIRSNPKILIIPLLYNLFLYIYFLMGDFKLTRDFNLSFTLPSIPPQITQVIEVELPRLQELILGRLGLPGELTYEELINFFTIPNTFYLVISLLILGMIASFIQSGFLGLIKADFRGNKATLSGFMDNARYFFIRLFLTKLLYFVAALLIISLIMVIFLTGGSAESPHLTNIGGILLIMGALLVGFLIIILLLVFHEFSIVEDDTGVFDGIRRSYITVKTNLIKTIKNLFLVALMMAIVGMLTQLVAMLSLLLSIFIYIPVGTLGVYVIYALYRQLTSTIKTRTALDDENVV